MCGRYQRIAPSVVSDTGDAKLKGIVGFLCFQHSYTLRSRRSPVRPHQARAPHSSGLSRPGIRFRLYSCFGILPTQNEVVELAQGFHEPYESCTPVAFRRGPRVLRGSDTRQKFEFLPVFCLG